MLVPAGPVRALAWAVRATCCALAAFWTLAVAVLALARGACLGAGTFLAGAAIWVVGQGGGQAGLFRPGLVDGGELVIMAVALAVAVRLAASLGRDGAETAS